jgi:hypothetical protein
VKKKTAIIQLNTTKITNQLNANRNDVLSNLSGLIRTAIPITIVIENARRK